MKIAVIWFVLGIAQGVILGDWVRSRFEVRRTLKTPLNSSQRVLKAGRKAVADKAVAGLK